MPATFITDRERRVLANLPIPRGIAELEHELRIDQHSPTFDPDDLLKFVKDLEKQGMVENLGSHQDMAKLMSSVQKNKKLLTIEDEQADIFTRRRKRPSDYWKTDNDFWMLTNEGLEWLKAPPPNAPDQDVILDTGRLEQIIESERERVVFPEFEGSIFDQPKFVGDPKAGGIMKEDVPLLEKLLPEEFIYWATLVSDHHEHLTGRRPRWLKPMAGGAGWTDAFESTLIDAENQKSTITAAAPWYMALTILAFTDTDTGTTADNGSHIPTYTGYARKSVAAADMNSASSGSASNANAIIYAACTAGSSTIVGFGNCDAATVGTLRKYGTCASTSVSTTQTPAQFAAGNYTTTAD